MMMVSEQIIQNQVNDFVTKDEAFTSVDIGNAIKRSGTWIRNREVAIWLRNNFNNPDYEITMIDVGRGFRANLYHPDYFDSDNYDGKNQKAINPDDFKTLHSINDDDNEIVTFQTESENTEEEEQDFNENSRTVKISKGRIWIPASIINQLGLDIGYMIDHALLGIPGNGKLHVHYDGRVSVNASKVGSFKDGEKITIYIKNNKVIYDIK